jgi:hypothetical protein
MSAESLARRDGPCKLCPEPIRAGEDYITKVKAVGWLHVRCAQGYQRVMAEHDDDTKEAP